MRSPAPLKILALTSMLASLVGSACSDDADSDGDGDAADNSDLDFIPSAS